MKIVTGYTCVAHTTQASRPLTFLFGKRGNLKMRGIPHDKKEQAEEQLQTLQTYFDNVRIAHLTLGIQEARDDENIFETQPQLVIIIKNHGGKEMYGPYTPGSHLYYDWCAPLETNGLEPFHNSPTTWREIKNARCEAGRQSHRFPHFASWDLEYFI
ncbi:MAG: hypothetical protein Q7R56_03730 [Nanoarchaeota archaeon]|nr:hypothetical protein [Nanoarchaeota archaeon]